MKIGSYVWQHESGIYHRVVGGKPLFNFVGDQPNDIFKNQLLCTKKLDRSLYADNYMMFKCKLGKL